MPAIATARPSASAGRSYRVTSGAAVGTPDRSTQKRGEVRHPATHHKWVDKHERRRQSEPQAGHRRRRVRVAPKGLRWTLRRIQQSADGQVQREQQQERQHQHEVHDHPDDRSLNLGEVVSAPI